MVKLRFNKVFIYLFKCSIYWGFNRLNQAKIKYSADVFPLLIVVDGDRFDLNRANCSFQSKWNRKREQEFQNQLFLFSSFRFFSLLCQLSWIIHSYLWEQEKKSVWIKKRKNKNSFKLKNLRKSNRKSSVGNFLFYFSLFKLPF